jgi:hypothetical protein
LFSAKGYAIFFPLLKEIEIVFDIPKKSQLRRKSSHLGQPKEGVYELSYEYTSVGFQIYAEKFGTSRPLLRRISHDRFILTFFRLKRYEPL